MRAHSYKRNKYIKILCLYQVNLAKSNDDKVILSKLKKTNNDNNLCLGQE